jgi:hypothetical protein
MTDLFSRRSLAVLAAALKAKPHWFLSDNTAHFSPALASATGLNISTSGDFLRELIVPKLFIA